VNLVIECISGLITLIQKEIELFDICTIEDVCQKSHLVEVRIIRGSLIMLLVQIIINERIFLLNMV